MLHNAALPPHMEVSVLFAMQRQCASNGIRTLYWFCPLLSRFDYIERWACPACHGPAPFPLRIATPHVGIWTPSNMLSPYPTRHLDRFSRLAELTIVTDRLTPTNRQTDRPRCTVCNNRPHLASAAMRPNNKCQVVQYRGICVTLKTDKICFIGTC